jgi:SAM-dependent methyltransferase
VAGFKAGKSRLDAVERALGDVAGKSLLHLQCHFGLSTLAWARLGAKVTGVDFSPRAIALAERLRDETGLAADFVCSDVYGLPDRLAAEFDYVFTSHGVLPWLHDLTRWAMVVARFLAPGGVFYLVDAHPFAQVFEDRDVTDFRVAYSYFHDPRPARFEERGSYADRDSDYHAVMYAWQHSLADVVTALLAAGLRLDGLQEYPFVAWQMFPFLEQDAEGWWRLPDRLSPLPLMFSLRATKGDD